MEFCDKLPLPNLIKLKGSKEESPWESLQLLVINHYGGIENSPVKQVSDIWIHPADYLVLDNMTKDWAKKRLKGFSKNYIDNQLGWLTLQVAPASFNIADLPDDIVPGFIYIRKSE